jgi:hypothetical protein
MGACCVTAVWIRAAIGLEWHRLTVVGQEHHGVACVLGAVPTDEPVLLSSEPPDHEPRCIGCDRDLRTKQSRVPTVDLRPRTRDGVPIGVQQPECTGLTARWCPRCGTCACPEYPADMNSPSCPLHAPTSPHAECQAPPADDLVIPRAPTGEW